MEPTVNPERLVSVPFSKTDCGVDFYINAASNRDIGPMLTQHRRFTTDFFAFYFFRRAKGHLLLGYRRIELQGGMVLVVAPHEQQQWHVEEEDLDYHFLIFREDFMHTFIADKFFVYRLHYYRPPDTPPVLHPEPAAMAEYERLLGQIRNELQRPQADSYNLIVSLLSYVLLVLNRAYAAAWHLPAEVAKNNYAYRFRDLLEQHVRSGLRVQDYADMLRISRVTLSASVVAQFGVSASHLLQQRLLDELKNELLFGQRTVSQLADDFHFSHPSHLMRFFKQQTGKTFTQYRRDYERGVYE